VNLLEIGVFSEWCVHPNFLKGEMHR